MAGDGPPLPPSAQPTTAPSLHSASPSSSRAAAATPPLSLPLAAPLHGHCPPPPVLISSTSGTSILPRERTTLTPLFEQQTCGELPAAGEVLGDPQPHASGEVHGELPKKICKKKCGEARGVQKFTNDSRIEQRDGKVVTTSCPSSKKSTKKKSIDACGELQRASDVRDSNEVPTSLPLSKKSAKKVTIKNSDKSPTAGTKRPLSEASGSSRAKKAAKLINAKVATTQLQSKSMLGCHYSTAKQIFESKCCHELTFGHFMVGGNISGVVTSISRWQHIDVKSSSICPSRRFFDSAVAQ